MTFNPKQFCDHCTYTINDVECACGCTGYDEWCGCEECLRNHFPSVYKNQNKNTDIMGQS